jgi:hypothetical protein
MEEESFFCKDGGWCEERNECVGVRGCVGDGDDGAPLPSRTPAVQRRRRPLRLAPSHKHARRTSTTLESSHDTARARYRYSRGEHQEAPRKVASLLSLLLPFLFLSRSLRARLCLFQGALLCISRPRPLSPHQQREPRAERERESAPGVECLSERENARARVPFLARAPTGALCLSARAAPPAQQDQLQAPSHQNKAHRRPALPPTPTLDASDHPRTKE